MFPIRVSASVLAAAFVIVGLTGASSACGGGEIIFEDALTAPDYSWGLATDDSTRSLGPGGVTWTTELDKSRLLLNHASLYENFEVCVDMAMEPPEKSAGYVGLIFWGVDKENTYTVDLFPYDGAFAVYRLQNGKLLTPIPWTESAAIKKESGAVNHLSVAVRDNQVVITVNDTKVLEFKGIPPKGGGLAGLDMGTHRDDSGSSKFTFANFQVRELAE